MEPFKVPKKVNRHVLKALELLQVSRSSFVPIEAITDRVKKSLRYTKPVTNLEYAIQESLKNQNELGIVTRLGSSYAMALAFKGLRSDRKFNRIQQNKSRSLDCDSLTADEIAKVRKMLSKVQKPSVKRKPNAAVAPRVICKKKSSRIIPAVAQKASEMSTLVTLHSSPMCNKCRSQFVPQIYPTGPLLRSAIGVPEKTPTGLKTDEIFNIPKKVNRHVLKAVRHFTEEEGYEFAPLHTIKDQAMWTMRNLIPVKDVETVIERSLQNLTDVGVLSERDQTYRLDCGKPLAMATSLSIFGKVSASFLPPSPSQDMGDAFGAQNILYMEESEMPLGGPMPHVSASQSSTYRGGDTNFQADQASSNVGSLSSLSSQNSNTRPAEGISGMENGSLLGLCGSLSYLPSGSLSQKRHSAIGVSQDQKSSTNFGEGESCFQAKQTSTPSEASADIASLSSLGSQNMSIRSTEGVFDRMNASMIGLCGSLSCEELPLESLSQEWQNATEANNISVMDLDEPMSKDSHVSVIQEMQAYLQAQLTSTSGETMDMDIRPVEGVFGTELHGENASSVGRRVSPICVQIPSPFFYQEMDNSTLFGPRGSTFCLELPLVASGSSSQEMTNVFGANNISHTVLDEPMLKDSLVSVIQEQQTSMSAQAINIDIRPDEEVLGTELDVENASSAGPRGSPLCVHLPQVASETLSQEIHKAYAEISPVSVSLGVQGSWLESMPNESPNFQAEQTSTSAQAMVGPRDSPICLQIPSPFFYQEMDNSTLFGPRGSTFCLELPQVASGSSSQEMTNVFGANNISYTVLDEPMLEDSHVSVIQEQQTSMSAQAINIDIRPDEEVLGTELDVEHASSVGPRDSPICVQIPSLSMDNAHAEDSHDSVSIGAQSFHESWYQSIPNEAPSLLPFQVEQSATSAETQNVVSIHQEEPHESPNEQ